MASSQYSCSVRQGLNFEKDQQLLVGHLVSMTVSGQALGADMALTIPTATFSSGEAVTASTSVVGVIADISWQVVMQIHCIFLCMLVLKIKN